MYGVREGRRNVYEKEEMLTQKKGTTSLFEESGIQSRICDGDGSRGKCKGERRKGTVRVRY